MAADFRAKAATDDGSYAWYWAAEIVHDTHTGMTVAHRILRRLVQQDRCGKPCRLSRTFDPFRYQERSSFF